MNFEVVKEEKNTVILVNTRLDSSTAGEFEKLLEKEVPNVEEGLILDVKNMDFISSIGLRILVALRSKLANGEKEFVIKNANSSVREIFKISGFLRVVKLV